MSDPSSNNNELALAGGAPSTAVTDSDLVLQPEAEEKPASRVDSMLGNLDLLRQVILVLSVAICVA